MVNYFIYAKDFSGSTGGEEYYHSNGLKSLDDFKRDVETIKQDILISGGPTTDCKIIYLHWGSKCYEVDEDTTIQTYKQLKDGNMWTEPESIIEWIKNNLICEGKDKIKLLYIITDGQIFGNHADKCALLNENMDYETVVFHAFNKELSEIDLSVAASFFKNRCKVYRNFEIFGDVDISDEFDYSQINIDDFEAEKDSLTSYIKFKFIGKSKQDDRSLQEIDKLKKLRQRLFKDLSAKTKSELNLDTNNRDEFLCLFKSTEWYKKLYDPTYDQMVDIDKTISTLINYIENESKSYAFEELKFKKKFDTVVAEEPMVTVDVNFTAEQEIEFPDIILDDERGIPVIILTDFNLLDKIIFHKSTETDKVSPASFCKFRSSMDCPLFLLKDPDIQSSIGYFYTLNVFKQLLEKTTRTEPRTRRPFHGGLVLTDSDQFDKYNDYVLAATYFDSKKVNYNVGLFYYVLWKNCENKEWMDRNIVEQFRKYCMRRISETKCKLGLSSLPLDPPHRTSLLTALWYCVELSSCIFKNDPQHFMHERVRMYFGIAHHMIDILRFFKYDLDLESIEKRLDIIRHVMILKKIQSYREKVYFLLQSIFKSGKGFLICEFKNSSNLNKLNYLKLNHKDMLREDILNEEVHLNDYIYLLHLVGDLRKTKDVSVEICEKTFRPLFVVGESKSYYNDLIKITYKVIIKNDDDKDKIKICYEPIDSLELNRILSLYKLFINCVSESKKYPTLDEYIKFIIRRNKFNEQLVTIFPRNTYKDVKAVYERYQNIVVKIDVKTFITTSNQSVTRSERIKAEETMNFNNTKDIDAFIAGEEFLWNMKSKEEIEEDEWQVVGRPKRRVTTSKSTTAAARQPRRWPAGRSSSSVGGRRGRGARRATGRSSSAVFRRGRRGRGGYWE